MPIYEYRCTACDKVFEYMQRMSDDPKTTCESCGGALERLISRSAFHLKGGGWYKDLYSSTKPESKSKGDGGGDTKTSESSSSKSSDSSGGSSSSGD
jgi:putative FmdB family regulatory protein